MLLVKENMADHICISSIYVSVDIRVHKPRDTNSMEASKAGSYILIPIK